MRVFPRVSWFDHGLSWPGFHGFPSLRHIWARSAPKAKAGHDYTKLEEELRFTPGLPARSATHIACWKLKQVMGHGGETHPSSSQSSSSKRLPLSNFSQSGTGQMEAFAKAKPSCFEGPGTDRSRPVRPNTTVSWIDFGTFWDHFCDNLVGGCRWNCHDCHPIRKSGSLIGSVAGGSPWMDLNASGRDYAQGALWKHGEVQPLASLSSLEWLQGWSVSN